MMNLPRQFYYGSRRTGIAGLAACFGAIAAFMAVRALHCGPANDVIGVIPLTSTGATVYYWVRVGLNVAVGAAFAGMAVIYLTSLVSRLAHPRTLELAGDALLLPYGFLQKQTRRIAYADIRKVREQIWGRHSSLCITTAERTSMISTFLLTGASDYQAIKDFMFAHAPAAPAPVRKAPAILPTRIEFMSRQAAAERQIRRRVVPCAINYSVMLVMIPAIVALLLLVGLVPLTNFHPEVQTIMRERLLWMLALCGILYGGALLANWDGKRQLARLAYKCPCCHKYLIFAPGKAALKTGLCAHCDEPVFY